MGSACALLLPQSPLLPSVLFPFFFFLVFFKKIEVSLINNIVLVSGVQHRDSLCTHTFFFRFFSLIGYYKILSMVPCALQ